MVRLGFELASYALSVVLGADLFIRVMKHYPNLSELAGECISAITSENVICGSGAPTTIRFSDTIQFHVETAGYYGAGLGYKVWPAAIALSRAIHNGDIDLGEHSRVIEIGSGVGLVGIAAAAFGKASHVCFTDMMEGLLDIAMRNAKRNFPHGSFSAKVVDWRDPEGMPNDADVMLGADVIYEEAHAKLILGLLRHFHGHRAVLALMTQRPGYGSFTSELGNLKGLQVRQISVPTIIGDCAILQLSLRDQV